MQPRNRMKMTFLAVPLFLLACGKNPEQRAAEISREVDAALSSQRWEQAEKKAQEILALSKLSDATRDQARLKLEQAKSEQQAKLHFQRFSGAAGLVLPHAGKERIRPHPAHLHRRPPGKSDQRQLQRSLHRCQAAAAAGPRCRSPEHQSRRAEQKALLQKSRVAATTAAPPPAYTRLAPAALDQNSPIHHCS